MIPNTKTAYNVWSFDLRADIEDLYIPRKGCRGIITIEATYNIAKERHLVLKEQNKYVEMGCRHQNQITSKNYCNRDEKERDNNEERKS